MNVATASTAYDHFRVEYRNGLAVLQLVDPPQFNDFGRLHTEVLAYLDAANPAMLVIDFSHISYCSTAVFNAMVMVASRMAEKPKLCGMNSVVRDGFTTLNLEGTVFELYDTIDAAQRSLDSSLGKKPR